jgi:pilus assembly protein CpaB
MIQLPRKYLPLIISLVLGLAATYLVNLFLRQKTEEAKERAAQMEKNIASVVVAKSDIPAGTTITAEMLKEEKVYRNMLQPRAATDIERIVDKIAIAPIAKGEQVLLNKVTIAGQETSLATKIPRGKRAISIPVDNISAVGGMIRPGDHVDVMGLVPIPVATPDGKTATQMTTMPLFQDVLVLAVGQEYSSVSAKEEKKSEKSSAAPLITLALSPQETSLIAFVQEQGKIRLVLRSPEDTQVQPAVPASWDVLFKTVMPQAFQQPEEDSAGQRTVEIYRGLKKEVKVLKD